MIYIIYLSGMPGAGKTTLSDNIIKKIKRSVLIRRNFVKELISDFGNKKNIGDIVEEDGFIYKTMVSMAKVAVQHGYSVIVDGGGWRVKYYNEFKRLTKNKDIKMISIRLNCDLMTSKSRTASRAIKYRWSKKKLENFSKMYEKIPFDLILNTDEDNKNKCLEKVMKMVVK